MSKAKERQKRISKERENSKGRVRAKCVCPIAGKCGGCQYINLLSHEDMLLSESAAGEKLFKGEDQENPTPYERQLAQKYEAVSRQLCKFGRIEVIIGMENPYHYRNKVNAAFKHRRNGEIISGVYEQGTHNVLQVSDCLIENRQAQEIIASVRSLLKSFKITVYNEDSGYGLLRHVMVRTGHATGQVMVVMVTASPIFPSKKNFAKALLKLHPEITTIVQNINEKRTSMVLGDRNVTIYGKGYIEDELCKKKFRISPTSFYQVNAVQTEHLYKKAMEFADLTGKETVIDAYCGTGTIGIVASDKAQEVIGVELNREAVRDARVNAKINGVANIGFYNNDAGKFMVGLAQQNKTVDVVFMDPPRSGSSEAFMSSLLTLAPTRIVYVSCGPESLARDLEYMTKNGKYRVEKLVAVDLFPWTEHVETVALMSRKEK